MVMYFYHDISQGQSSMMPKLCNSLTVTGNMKQKRKLLRFALAILAVVALSIWALAR